MVAGELPELPFLAELPDRGVGADAVGRAIGMLVDIYAEVVPSGWRITAGPGREVGRAKDFLAWDLDALEEHYAGAPQVKVQVCGPWTVAARTELATGNRMITDQGAVRDLAESLAEGLSAHLDQVRRRLPGSRVILQVDEPALRDVIEGNLRTASGFGTVRAIGRQRAGELLRTFTERFVDTVLIGTSTPAHPQPGTSTGPVTDLDALGLLREAGCSAVAVDFTTLGSRTSSLDFLGEGIESGLVLLAGTVPARESRAEEHRAQDRQQRRTGSVSGPTTAERARPITEPMAKLGFAPEVMARQIVVTPSGSLADVAPDRARRVLTLCRDVARMLAEPMDDHRS
ncbi:methionine synthase [Nakamurella silvestris]|nr:methionine synthase [Nakamurella silvestris]